MRIEDLTRIPRDGRVAQPKGSKGTNVDDDIEMCECEIDWTCPLHGGGPSWIDRRFQGMDADEARAYGRMVDA